MTLSPDMYESDKGNNESGAASALTATSKGTAKALTIHDGNDTDWYSLSLPNTGTAKNLVKAVFSNATGHLDMELYKADGVTRVGRSTLTEKSEQISLEGLGAGDYLLKVSGLEGAQGKYNLTWDQGNYGPKIDTYDSGGSGNNDRGTATDLVAIKARGSASNLSIHSASDEDWYRLELDNTGTAKNLVKAAFSNATGRLDMELYKADGVTRVGRSTLTEKSEQISLEGLEAGVYYVKVSGTGEGSTKAQGKYNLTWDQSNYGPKIDTYDSGGSGNSMDTATDLAAIKVRGSASNLSVSSVDDVDWYRLELDNTGTAKNLVKATFSNATGRLDMELFDASGKEVTNVFSTLTEKSEQISLEGLEQGVYYVKVSGTGEGSTKAQGKYTLNWDQSNYGPKIDTYDSGGSGNNDRGTATDLAAIKLRGNTANLSIHSASDEDWYRLELNNTGFAKNLVKATYSSTNGRLDMELFDASGEKVTDAVSTMTEKSEQISLAGLEQGVYYVKVSGMSEGGTRGQGKYTLTWDQSDYGPKIDKYDTTGENGAEVNGTVETASLLPSARGTLKNLSIHSTSDVDFYRIQLTGSGKEKNFVKVLFDEKNGPLDIKLYDRLGDEVKDAVTTTDKGVEIALEGRAVGMYYLGVSGVEKAQNTYTLSWDGSNYASALAYSISDYIQLDTSRTDYETNNEISRATVLLQHAGKVEHLDIAASDEDFYRLVLSGEGTADNFVRALFSHRKGNLDLTLYDENNVEVASSTSKTDNEEISLEGLEAGTYYLKVHGVGSAKNTYDLQWNRSPAAGAPDELAAAGTLSSTGGTINESTGPRHYKFTLASDATANNYITVNDSIGLLPVSILDASGNVLHTDTAGTKINLSGLEQGNYYLRLGDVLSKNETWTYSSISSNLASSSAGEMVVGTEYASIFPVNSSGTEYAYLMGYGNVGGDILASDSIWSDPLFFDAEKSVSNKQDDYQCWAATASNMLAWTGWGEQGLPDVADGTPIEDAIFSEFSASFPDRGGQVETGISWFFNGAYKVWSNSLVPTYGTGDYMGTSGLPHLLRQKFDDPSMFASMAEALHNNMSVGISLKGGISHAVTVWGYTYDVTKSYTDPERYTGLLITDSDSNKLVSEATEAPDILQKVSLTWNEGSKKYYTKDLGNKSAYIYDFVALAHSDSDAVSAVTALGYSDSVDPVADAMTLAEAPLLLY